MGDYSDFKTNRFKIVQGTVLGLRCIKVLFLFVDDDLLTVGELQQLYDSLGDATEALTQAFQVFDYEPDGMYRKSFATGKNVCFC